MSTISSKKIIKIIPNGNDHIYVEGGGFYVSNKIKSIKQNENENWAGMEFWNGMRAIYIIFQNQDEAVTWLNQKPECRSIEKLSPGDESGPCR